MIVTLSESRNEKLVFEWSDEIEDKHAQDFCDINNWAFTGYNYDLDYIHRKYGEGLYGKSFIIVIYKDDKPIATWGGWRNDLSFKGRTAFQLGDFVTILEARKGGYVLDMHSYILDEIGKLYPKSVIYGFPGPMSWPVMKALGYMITPLYLRTYHGATKDFKDNVPFFDDDYVEKYLAPNKNALAVRLGGRYYFASFRRLNKYIPCRIILGEINAKWKDSFRQSSRLRPMLYYSRTPGVLGERKMLRAAKYDMADSVQNTEYMPPFATKDTWNLHFNPKNKN